MYFPRQRQEGKLLLELCSQLLVVWKKQPALTVFWLLKRALPDSLALGGSAPHRAMALHINEMETVLL